MPFSFQLPTTSSVQYTDFLSSSTHPSLPFTATIHREVVRTVLKKHKRLPDHSKAANLTNVASALENYIPYLFALDLSLSGKLVSGEEVDITLVKEVEVEWRTSLSATISGREPPRVRGSGLDYEIVFLLSTLAYLQILLAQAQLRALYSSVTPSTEERTGVITTATKHLLQASSIHAYLVSRCHETLGFSPVIETTASAQEALADLALAEATLLAVLKDDPYPGIVQQDRNKSDNEWKFKAPEIARVRAHLGARLCLAAAEHAEKANALLNALGNGKSNGVDEALIKYTSSLRRTSRAKACRLFGIDSEMRGETGQGIAWLIRCMDELGFAGKAEDSKLKGLAKIKKDWMEKKEDKRVETGGEWGSDAGRYEEARIIEMLDTKWNKMNDTVSISEFAFEVLSDLWAGQYPSNSLIKCVAI